MKRKTLLITFLSLFLITGCATAPKKERAKLPPSKVEAPQPQPPPAVLGEVRAGASGGGAPGLPLREAPPGRGEPAVVAGCTL